METRAQRLLLLLCIIMLRSYRCGAFCSSMLRTIHARKGVRLTATGSNQEKQTFYITTPIYYVNDKPHIGHAYTSVACDVLARFARLSGKDVFFLTGTDEHGQKVQASANAANVSPQDFCNAVSQNFRDLLELMNISHDKFIRTTDDYHKESVQQLWKILLEKEQIYKGTYSGWYSVRDECFYSESELVDGKAPTGANVEWVAKEESYFFKLSEYQDKLLEFYNDHPDFIAPQSRRNEVLSFVQGGLKDLSISRTSFSWGVPVPGDDGHVMYVWIDALTNYLSGIGYPDDKYKKYWPADMHVVGKDILRFHAVYWPALLMAANIELPKRLFAHGWWTKDGQKISKSLGNVIDPVELVQTYGVDQTRFFLMSEVSFGKDGDFSDMRMIYKVNANLANELGNLCQRALSMVFKNCDKQVPEPNDLTDEDRHLLATAQSTLAKCQNEVDTQAIHKYVELLIHLVGDTNKYIDVQAPWVLKKMDPERMQTVLYVILEVLRYAAILYQPLIPTSANKILDQLTVPDNERTFAHLTDDYKIYPGNAVSKPQGIFPRLEVPEELAAAT